MYLIKASKSQSLTHYRHLEREATLEGTEGEKKAELSDIEILTD
jgi:hypothetical protein